jgi:hypothetical protein
MDTDSEGQEIDGPVWLWSARRSLLPCVRGRIHAAVHAGKGTVSTNPVLYRYDIICPKNLEDLLFYR